MQFKRVVCGACEWIPSLIVLAHGRQNKISVNCVVSQATAEICEEAPLTRLSKLIIGVFLDKAFVLSIAAIA
jgi:hypothetical protein